MPKLRRAPRDLPTMFRALRDLAPADAANQARERELSMPSCRSNISQICSVHATRDAPSNPQAPRWNGGVQPFYPQWEP